MRQKKIPRKEDKSVFFSSRAQDPDVCRNKTCRVN